jgi:hypothetical protein
MRRLPHHVSPGNRGNDSAASRAPEEGGLLPRALHAGGRWPDAGLVLAWARRRLGSPVVGECPGDQVLPDYPEDAQQRREPA